MSVVKADRFTALKARVKAEMQRRNQSGSVAGYGGSAYDYTEAPAAGKTVRAEHRDKLVTPMRAVNSDLVPASAGSVIRASELANLETRVTAWSARSMTDRSGSDCKSGCTGTCYTGCATGCYSCGASCGDGCTGCTDSCSGCGSGCGKSCSGCTDSCNGCDGCEGCGGNCTGSCYAACADNCLGGCESDCVAGCKTYCTATCKGHGTN